MTCAITKELRREEIRLDRADAEYEAAYEGAKHDMETIEYAIEQLVADMSPRRKLSPDAIRMWEGLMPGASFRDRQAAIQSLTERADEAVHKALDFRARETT